jgi:hypothetical protein
MRKNDIEWLLDTLKSEIDGYLFNNLLDDFRNDIDHIIDKYKERIEEDG